MLTRKTFLVQMASGTWMLALGGCGGGGGDGDTSAPTGNPPPAGSGCSATAVSGNHGHTLAIPTADLSSAVAMTYNIQGAADHNHQVTFSAAQLAQLKAGQAVTVTSTVVFSHSHDVTETCT
jgi:hypothetical protein